MAGRKAKVAVTTIGTAPAIGTVPQADRVQEVLDYQATRSRRQSYPNNSSTKLLSVRIDADVYDYFQSLGEDWKARINGALRTVSGLDERGS